MLSGAGPKDNGPGDGDRGVWVRGGGEVAQVEWDAGGPSRVSSFSTASFSVGHLVFWRWGNGELEQRGGAPLVHHPVRGLEVRGAGDML